MFGKIKRRPPIHPGETLREDFLKPLGLSVNRLATELFVPATRINDIVRARRSITADTALRLARYFGTTPQFWMNLQSNYDLEACRRRARRRDLRTGSAASRCLTQPVRSRASASHNRTPRIA
ncbi:MAG: HigA family addiction module antitoxin [Bryobacteraceae bacterium]|jgi:addiction module HigA family antidote